MAAQVFPIESLKGNTGPNRVFPVGPTIIVNGIKTPSIIYHSASVGIRLKTLAKVSVYM